MKNLPVTVVANGFQSYYLTDLVNGLAVNGVDIDFLGSDIYDRARIDPSINFINIRGSHSNAASVFKKVARVLRYYWRLLSYARSTDNRVFHIQWLRFNLIEGVLLNLVFRLLGKKVVFTAHNVLPHMKAHIYNRLVFHLVYRVSDRIIVHTSHIKNRIVSEFGVDADKIEVIRHGVYKAMDHPSVTREEARARLGFARGDRVVLFFGNIVRYKGLDLLVDAFMRSRDRVDHLKLVVAGRVAEDYRDELDSLIPASLAGKDIIIKPRFIPDEEAELLFKASDVVALPYTEASQSGVMLLSYAYGRPVIAPDIGDFRLDVVEGMSGHIFHAGDPGDLSEKIDLFFGCAAADAAVREKSIKEHANSIYSWEKIGADLRRIYQPLAAGTRSRV